MNWPDGSFRVLHVLPAEPFGGIQVLATALAREQRRTGTQATLFFTNSGEAARSHTKGAGVPAWLPEGDGRGLVQVIASLRSLHGAAADIVHLHAPPPWVALNPALFRGKRIVTHLHSGVGPRAIHRAAAARLAGRSDALVAVSGWVARISLEVLGRGQDKLSVIYNGIDLPPQAGCVAARSPPVFGMATRFGTDKGIDGFLEAARHIARLVPDARFRLAGDGAMRESAMRRARDELPGKVDFPGFVTDMIGFWHSIDVALFGAPAEPFGLRLIEPVAHGVPVVAFLTGAGSDEVADRCRAIIAVPWPDHEGFARHAVELARDHARRCRMVNEGRADLAQHFSMTGMERRLDVLYSQILGLRPRRQ